MTNVNDEPLYLPSVDVCAICGDCYCDGIMCLSEIDTDKGVDLELLEQLQTWVRYGKAYEYAAAALRSSGQH